MSSQIKRNAFAGNRPLSIVLLLIALACYVFVLLFSSSASNLGATSQFPYVAIAFDLIVFLPAYIYFAFIRRFRVSALLAIPIIWIGIALSSLLIPSTHTTILLPFFVVTIAIELFIAIKEIRRLIKVSRGFSCEQNLQRRLRLVFSRFIGNGKAATLMSYEVSFIYYTLFSWRAKPVRYNDASHYSYHKYGIITPFVAMLAIVVVEIVVVHILVMHWSTAAAVILSVLSVYALIMLVGNMRAMMHNPIALSKDTLFIRDGLSCQCDIPLVLIKEVSKVEPKHVADIRESVDQSSRVYRKKEILNLTWFGNKPTCWIYFTEPVSASRLYGMKQEVSALGVIVDAPNDFLGELSDFMTNAAANS